MITVERAKQLRAIIEKTITAAGMSDDEALSCIELFPRWSPSGTYEAGAMVQHGEKLYRCVQAHTAQSDWTPPAAVSLWGEVTIDPGTGYDVWKQPTGGHDAYNKGDRVIFEGSVYESLINGNVWSPVAYPAVWSKIE